MSGKRLIIEFKPILAPGGRSGTRVEVQEEGDVEAKELMAAAAHLIGTVANEIGADPYRVAVATIMAAEDSMRMMHGGNPQ